MEHELSHNYGSLDSEESNATPGTTAQNIAQLMRADGYNYFSAIDDMSMPTHDEFSDKFKDNSQATKNLEKLYKQELDRKRGQYGYKCQ